MNAKNSVLFIVAAFLMSVGAYFFQEHSSKSGTQPYAVDVEPATNATQVPKIAAALPDLSDVININTQSLNYGALVGGDTERFIQLTTDGSVFASGDISGQSEYSYVCLLYTSPSPRD